jgi:GNAT superfamily N-acetyltransferase
LTDAAYKIRRGEHPDIAALRGIEIEAATLFYPYFQETGLTKEILRLTSSAAEAEEACNGGRLWVAESETGEIVGFAIVFDWGTTAHLDELDVLPAHGRQGVGTSLVRAVCEWARERGYRKVTISTFRDIPWNEPFYLKQGFRAVNPIQLDDMHRRLVESERARGLRTDVRVIMEYRIS